MMVGNNLKETQLQQIVDKTILFADKDGDGKINFEEFCDVVGNTDVHKKMVVDVWWGGVGPWLSSHSSQAGGPGLSSYYLVKLAIFLHQCFAY